VCDSGTFAISGGVPTATILPHAVTLQKRNTESMAWVPRAFVKKTQKTPRREIEIALQRAKEVIER